MSEMLNGAAQTVHDLVRLVRVGLSTGLVHYNGGTFFDYKEAKFSGGCLMGLCLAGVCHENNLGLWKQWTEAGFDYQSVYMPIVDGLMVKHPDPDRGRFVDLDTAIVYLNDTAKWPLEDMLNWLLSLEDITPGDELAADLFAPIMALEEVLL